MIEIEFKTSGTGSYSPWHLAIADKYNAKLVGTCDIGSFVKIGEDVYKLQSNHYYKLYQYFTTLEDMNNKGEVTDEEVLKEIDDIVNNRNKDFFLTKCKPLKEFEEIIKNRKNDS